MFQSLHNAANCQRYNQQNYAEHEQPVLNSNKFREWQFKAHYARQQFVNRAAYNNREESENLQLSLCRSKPSEFCNATKMRTAKRNEHQRRQNKSDRSEFNVAKRSA